MALLPSILFSQLYASVAALLCVASASKYELAWASRRCCLMRWLFYIGATVTNCVDIGARIRACRRGGWQLRSGMDRVAVPRRIRPQIPGDRPGERQDLGLAGEGGDEAVEAAQQRARQNLDYLGHRQGRYARHASHAITRYVSSKCQPVFTVHNYYNEEKPLLCF